MNKIFNTTKATKQMLRRTICDTAKEFGVKRVVFSDRSKYVNGTYNAFTKVLYLNSRLTKSQMLNVFFHELGHHFAVKTNKWKNYHFNLVPFFKYEDIFKIENGVDQIAKKLWDKYVNQKNWGKYKYSYPKSKKKTIINNFISK